VEGFLGIQEEAGGVNRAKEVIPGFRLPSPLAEIGLHNETIATVLHIAFDCTNGFIQRFLMSLYRTGTFT